MINLWLEFFCVDRGPFLLDKIPVLGHKMKDYQVHNNGFGWFTVSSICEYCKIYEQERSVNEMYLKFKGYPVPEDTYDTEYLPYWEQM